MALIPIHFISKSIRKAIIFLLSLIQKPLYQQRYCYSGAFKILLLPLYPHNSFTCGLDSILLKTNISGFKPSFTFHWTSNNINFSNNYIDSLVYVLDTGIYEITIIDTLNGCSSFSFFRCKWIQRSTCGTSRERMKFRLYLPFITHTGGFLSTQPNEIAIKWSTTNGSIVVLTTNYK
jgi:hypothetical protein